MRSIALDSLRGIAIILVLFRHYHFSFLMNKIGWIGVDLFFVLSGFLVSGLLFKEYQRTESIKPMRFLIRRGLKIYPLFYFFLALTYLCYFVLKSIGRENSLHIDRIFYEAFFVQNYFKGIWIHTWSLAVEEHFYFLLAAVSFLLFKKFSNHRLIITGIILILCFTLGLRIVTQYALPNLSLRQYLFTTHLRIDSLLFGVLISYLFHFLSNDFFSLANRYWRQGLAIATLFLITPFVWELNSRELLTIGLTLIYLSFGVILWVVIAYENEIIGFKPLRFLIKALSYIGFYSYSIYLFHVMMAAFAMPVIVKTLPFTFAGKALFIVYVLVCILSGVIFSKLIEFPFLAVRDKYFPR